jgi:hypothetical protein
MSNIRLLPVHLHISWTIHDMSKPTLFSVAQRDLPELLSEIGELIRLSRQRTLRAVDTIQVQTCWEVGRHIVDFEQGGAARHLWAAPVAGIGQGADSGIWQGIR